MSNYLFVYGILRSGIKSSISDEIKALGTKYQNAKIYGYKLSIDINKRPIVYPSSNQMDFVVGELIECENFQKLLEIVGKFSGYSYKRIEVSITTEKIGIVSGFVYIPKNIEECFTCNYHDYLEYFNEKIIKMN